MISLSKNKTYQNSQYENDVKAVENAEKGTAPLDLSAFKRLMVNDLCTATSVLTNYKIGYYDIEHVQRALLNPRANWRMLVDVSKYLMLVSPFYMRINNYFAKMGLFNYTVDTYDVKNTDSVIEKYKNDFWRLLSQLEKMNLKHEFGKIMDVLPSEDLYCGLLFEDSSDFFIHRVPSKYCKILQIQDGVYSFGIELSVIDPLEIRAYPQFVQQAYIENRKNGTYDGGWYIPPADKQICIKFNESYPFPYPFLIMLAKDIFDIDTYKKLKLQKARVDNYKAIVTEIPIDKNAVDKPLLTEATISALAEMNKENMPDDVGLLHTFGDVEAISFKDNTNNTNNLSDAITNLYDASGVPSSLFNGSTTVAALKMALENDSSIVYRTYRQFERWVNRFIKLRKYNKSSYKFKLRIHDSTVYNRDSVSDSFLKAAEHGLPFKMDYATSLGISQTKLVGNLFMENDVFELHNKFIPLPTSYTMSSESIGRPTNESQGKDLSESGEQTSDSGANENR